MKSGIFLIFITCFYSTVIFGQNETNKTDTLFKQLDKNNIMNSFPEYMNLGVKVIIDENKNLVFSKVVDNLKMTKDDIYVKAFSYFAYNYKDAKSVIQQQDKDAGVIIGKGYFNDFSSYNKSKNIGMGLTFTTYDTYSATHILRIDIKDGRARIILTVDNYEINRGISSTKSVGSAILTGSAGMMPYSQLKIINKLICSCAPIDTTSISVRTAQTLLSQGYKKANKSITKSVTESITFDYESELKAFPKLFEKVLTTIENFEKSLNEGNTSKEAENW
ncbi:MAG: DUF4468 domain-containing protein [Paludibacter sp.]